MVADARLGFAGEISRRPLGNDVDRTGERVAAIERALRPSQHFDALDSAQRTEAARRTACINVIDEHADRAFRARIEGPRADTANIELRARGAEAAEIEGRNPRREIFEAEIGRAHV